MGQDEEISGTNKILDLLVVGVCEDVPVALLTPCLGQVYFERALLGLWG